MRYLGTYLGKIDFWRLAPNQDLWSSQDHLEGMALLPLPACLLSTKVVPHLTSKVFSHNQLPGSSLVSWERPCAYCRRTFQVFALSAKARLTTYLKRVCVWPDFLEKNCWIFLFVVGEDNPLSSCAGVLLPQLSFFSRCKKKENDLTSFANNRTCFVVNQ